MDDNQSIERQGGYENLLYGNIQQPLLDLPIDDLIATNEASLQYRGPQPGEPAAQYPSAGCRTLDRDAVTSKVIPETAYQVSRRQSQGVAISSPYPDTWAVGRQAAFYNANASSNGTPNQTAFYDANASSNGMLNQPAFYDVNASSSGMPNQPAFYDVNASSNGMPNQAPFYDVNASSNGMPNQAVFYDANIGFSSNQRTNSINQLQGRPSVSLPVKRNFAAVDQVSDNPIQGPVIHPGAMLGNANGNSPLLPGFQSPEKRQRLPIFMPKEKTQSEKSEEVQKNGHNPAPPPNPSSNGSSGQREESTRSSTDDTNSGRGSGSTPPTVHSHPSLNLIEHVTNRINPQLRSLVNLEHSTRNTLLSMNSYMYKVMKTNFFFNIPESAPSQETQTPSQETQTTTAFPTQLESAPMLIRVLRQFLEELKADFTIHQDVVPLSCPGMGGDLADVIGRQQCLMGLALFPELVSKILSGVKQSQGLRRLAFPSKILAAIKHAWLCRLKAWWNEKKGKLERTFRGGLDGFLGSEIPGGVVQDSPAGNSFVYAPGPEES